MLLRDKLLAELAAMGLSPTTRVSLQTCSVSGTHRRPSLVAWWSRRWSSRIGARSGCEPVNAFAPMPLTLGRVLLRDAQDSVLYVGKANNIRRRLRTHFAARRWHMLKPGLRGPREPSG